MSDNKNNILGFSPCEAVWLLLRLKGYEENFVVFKDQFPVDDSSNSLIAPLELNGIQARISLIQIEDLPYLELPTILQLKNKSWVLLLELKRKGFKLKTQQGECSLSSANLASLLSGHALDLSPTLPESKTFWKRVLILLGRHKKNVTQVVFAAVLFQLFAISMPELTSIVMNHALPNGAASLLTITTLGLLVIVFFQVWTGWIREHILLFLTTRIEVTTKRGFLDHLLKLPFPVLQNKTIGEMMQAFYGLTAAREIFIERAFGAFLDGALCVLYLVSMFSKLIVPTMVVVFFTSIMAGLSVLIGHNLNKKQQFTVDAQSKERGYLSELIAGSSTIKAAGAELQGILRWLKYFRKELTYDLKKQRIGLWSEIGIGTFQQSMSVIVLIWGGNLCLKGDLKIGTLFAFIQLTSGFLSAVVGMVNTVLAFAVLRPQISKTQEIFVLETEKTQDYKTDNSQKITGPLILDNIWFRYTSEDPWILKGYSLCIEPGEKYTLSGASGSGKSTILRLIAGLYTPEKGSISVGGQSPESVRDKIFYLPQFVKLYSGSIIENLQVLSGEMSIDRLMDMSHRTGLHNFIKTLPMNYQTLLPPGGHTLSGGQRQIIALTAALASGRSIMLLDEAMSNIDTIQSASLYSTFNNTPCTIVMVTHHERNEKIQN